MSYLVLARKWRPTQFAEVTGQEHVTKTLTNAIRLNRVAHSFLFTGARGVGKTSTARILAKALNCAEGPTVEPCGVCASCLEIPEGRSLDVLEIDGASNRGIGEIRELRDGVRYAPSRDKYKIYIIDEVHMLTQEAFNALLKTLEEPPPHVIFIFATTEPQKIPVTILSRCQRFDFKRVPARVLIGRLSQILEAEGIRMEEGGLHLVARESEGSVRDALSLLDRIIASGGENISAEEVSTILGVADRRWLHQLMEAVFRREPARTIQVIHEVNHYGYDLQHFTNELVQFLRDLLVIRLGGSGAEKVTDLAESEFQAMAELVQQRSSEDLERLLKVAIQGIRDLTHAPYPQIVLEAMVVRMASLRPLRPMDDLIKRLMILERALPEGAVLPPLSESEGHLLTSTTSRELDVQVPPALPQVPESTVPVSGQREIATSASETAAVESAGESEPEPAMPIPTPEELPEVISEGTRINGSQDKPPESVPAPGEHASRPSPEASAEIPSGESDEEVREELRDEGTEPVAAPLLEAVSEAEPEQAEAEPEQAEAEPEQAEAEPEQAEAEPEQAEAEPEQAEAELVPALKVVPEPEPEEPESRAAKPMRASTDGVPALDEFLALMLEEDPALAGELSQGKLELTSGQLSIRFRSNLFTGRFEKGKPSMDRLEDRLRSFFTDEVSVEVGHLLEKNEEEETRYEEDDRKLQESYAARRQQVKELPVVAQLATRFEGEVVQVRLKGVDE